LRLFITGATGYIGRNLVSALMGAGHEVIAASRERPDHLNTEWVGFDLSSEDPVLLPINVDCVIHLAARTAHSNLTAQTEILAAQQLIEASLLANARFIFVSSQVARPDAPTEYGRTKHEIEQIVLASGGYVVRPGQVYGGEERGLFGVLVKAVKKLPAIPAFVPAPQIQPIHVDDLVSCLIQIAETEDELPRAFNLGSPITVSFTAFLNLIALQRCNRHKTNIPIPSWLVTLGVLFLGKTLASKFGVDKLTSLFNVPFMRTERDLSSLGVSLRSLTNGLTRSGHSGRRSLIREAQALIGFVLGRSRVKSSLVRRYVRAIEHVSAGRIVGLSPFFMRHPAYLALLDFKHHSGSPFVTELTERINIATLVAEASPATSAYFLSSDELDSSIHNATRIFIALANESFWLTLRLLLKPILKPTSFQIVMHHGT
jgi:NADH dehydrogenase